MIRQKTILICLFGAQETYLIIIKVDVSCASLYFGENCHIAIMHHYILYTDIW